MHGFGCLCLDLRFGLDDGPKWCGRVVCLDCVSKLLVSDGGCIPIFVVDAPVLQVWFLTGHCDPCRVCWFWLGGFAALWLPGFASAFALASRGFVGCACGLSVCGGLCLHAVLFCFVLPLLFSWVDVVPKPLKRWRRSKVCAAPCAKKFCQKFLDNVLDGWLQNR